MYSRLIPNPFRIRRMETGLSQEALARECGISGGSVRRLEGEAEIQVTGTTLKRVLDRLCKTPEDRRACVQEYDVWLEQKEARRSRLRQMTAT